MTGARGFTLLEVLIALAVLSIGVLAGLRALGVCAQSLADLQDRELAQWIAEDRLAEMRAYALFPPPGANERTVQQARRLFRVREEVKTTPNALFRRVDVRVYAQGDDRALSQLSGLVVQPLR